MSKLELTLLQRQKKLRLFKCTVWRFAAQVFKMELSPPSHTWHPTLLSQFPHKEINQIQLQTLLMVRLGHAQIGARGFHTPLPQAPPAVSRRYLRPSRGLKPWSSVPCNFRTCVDHLVKIPLTASCPSPDFGEEIRNFSFFFLPDYRWWIKPAVTLCLPTSEGNLLWHRAYLSTRHQIMSA